MSCCALCPCQLSWPSDTQGSKRDPINSEKAWLDFAVRLLSRELVGKGRGQETVWSEKCKPVWWDEKVGLPWKNPTSNPKDTKDILQKKYSALESRLLAEERFPVELVEEARLWKDGKVNDLFDLTLLISLLGKVRGVHRAVVVACGKIASTTFGVNLLNDMHQCVSATLHVLEGLKSHTPCASKRCTVYPEARTMPPLKKKKVNVESSHEPFICTAEHFRAPTTLQSLTSNVGSISSNLNTKTSSKQANKLQHHEISNHCTSQANHISEHVMPVGPTLFTANGPTPTTLKPKQPSKLVYHNPSNMATDKPYANYHNPSNMATDKPYANYHKPSNIATDQPNGINHNPSNMITCQPNGIYQNRHNTKINQPEGKYNKPSGLDTAQLNNKYNTSQTGEIMSTTRLDNSLMSYEDLPPSSNNVDISKDNTSCVQHPNFNLTPTASYPNLTSSSSDGQGGNGLVAVILDNFESLSPGQRNWLDDLCVEDPLLDNFCIDDSLLDDVCCTPPLLQNLKTN